MLNNQQMLSVNQLQAQIKLTEMWKAPRSENYALKIEKKKETEDQRISRSVTQGNFYEPKTQKTFIGDATRL